MKQARHLTLVERQTGAIPTSSREHREAQSQPMAKSTHSQPLLVAVLCNRLTRAIKAHDPVGAGHTRGTLVRLSLKSRERLTRAQKDYSHMINLGADA